MSSTIFVNYVNRSPDTNASDDAGSGDQSDDSPVRQTQSGRWEKFCPNCGEWIGLGVRGSEYSFVTHKGSKHCERVGQRKVQKKEEEDAAEELERSFGVHPSHTSHTTAHAASSSTTGPPPPSLSDESTHIKPASPHFAPITHPPRLPCTGVRYKWELGNTCKTYPFQYHETGFPTWFVGIGVPSPNDDIIELQSHECARFRDPSMEACLPCTIVPTSREFKRVLSLASRDPPQGTPYIYLSWAQAEKRLREAKDDVRRIRREVKWFSPTRTNGNVRSDDLVLERGTSQNG